ncbi:MAG: hypothetical protein RID91_00330 [Azospirillaceae bacterium]
MATRHELSTRAAGVKGRARAALAGAAGLVALAACGGGPSYDPEEPRGCPPVSIVRDAAEVTVFAPGGGRDATDVVARGGFGGYSGECVYEEEESAVLVDMSLELLAEQGPAGTGDSVALSYFVAVTDPEGAILDKRVFDAEVPVGPRSGVGGTREDLSQTIPLERLVEGQAHRILLGFQLSRDQLEYNRSAAAAAATGGVPRPAR